MSKHRAFTLVEVLVVISLAHALAFTIRDGEVRSPNESFKADASYSSAIPDDPEGCELASGSPTEATVR